MTIKIETFYQVVDQKGNKVAVYVARVPKSVPSTTGLLLTTDKGKRIALLSERKVKHPDSGYRYHEFRYTN